ncbi:MAG: PEP-CTERM sorting domain-containing protein [Planctomycetota bacterium]
MIVALLVLGITAPMWALSLSPGLKRGKFEDVGSFYEDADDDSDFLDDSFDNPGGFVPVEPGDELRNTFNVTSIREAVVGGDFEFQDSATEQLSGIVAGLTPLSPVPATGVQEIELGDLAGDGFDNGVVRFYLDQEGDGNGVSDYTVVGAGFGPDAWEDQTTYPSVNTDGEQLWLDMRFVPFPGGDDELVDPGDALLSESVNFDTNRGSGEAYLEAVGGSFHDLMVEDGILDSYVDRGGYLGGGGGPPGQTVDMLIRFDLDANAPDLGAPPWGNVSEDPFLFAVVPEPMTMMGVAMGIGGLAGYIRKRRINA